jgi:hypothetical protein
MATDDTNDDALPAGLTDDAEALDGEAAVIDGDPALDDLPASLITGDDGEPLEDVDDDVAILAESFSTDEDPEAEDPDAYLYKAPTVSFSDSAEEEVVADWPEEE